MLTRIPAAVLFLAAFMVYTAGVPRAAGAVPSFPFGADAAPDLYAPLLAGPGAFITARGGAPASALNPAANGDAQRIVFDLGYLGLPGLGAAEGFGSAAELGALFPTKIAVFAGSLRFLHSPFDGAFPVGTTFGGNFNAAKELYPGMNVGAGLDFGFGDGWTLAGDLGFRYNIGKLGALENFTFALVLRGLGKSWAPVWFTPMGGVSFDIISVKSEGKGPDPFRLGFSADIGIPSIVYFPETSLTVKTGLTMVIAEMITLSAAWPGASGLNVRELAKGAEFPALPSFGLGVNIALPSGNRRIAGGHLPSDGDLGITGALRPLYEGIWAMGAGLSWTVGLADRTPPRIHVDYPQTLYISPNNDGEADSLEFPVTITDQRYIESWTMEIFDGEGNTVRTYRNKERRPETQGVKNILSRLADVKSGVEVPPIFRWDGMRENGETAPDGLYSFVIAAADDNGNFARSPVFQVVVDNTPPEIAVGPLDDDGRIFSPDGDGSKDTLGIPQRGSEEDLWEGGIYDSLGNRVRSFRIENGSPSLLVWDGKDDAGQIVDDGVYHYRIGATDRARNRSEAGLDNIIVSTIHPPVSIFLSDAFFSPNGDGIKDTVSMLLQVPVREGITGWALTFRDGQGNRRRRIGGDGAPPERQDFDGRNDQGAVLDEGVYQGELSVWYRNGYVSSALSPPVTLDLTPPRASVRIEYPAFSPDGDGNQDEMIIYQEGSDELLWIGDIRRAGFPAERPVRGFRFQGIPPAEIRWDGHGDSGTFAADGEYTYELYSTDPAGNTGRSGAVRFTLSTADTPVMISAGGRAFSPNGNGVRDTIGLIPQIQVKEGITGYRLEVLDGGGRAIRTWEGSGVPPAQISWNGRDDGGAVAADGAYTAGVELRYVQGNRPSARSLPFILDTQAPRAELSAPFTLFSPNGDGRRDFIPFAVSTDGDDEWEAVIRDGGGKPVRTWNWTGRAPSLVWDGTDQAGNSAPDGAYRLELRSTDEGGNSTAMDIAGIVLDSRIPRVFLTAAPAAVAPKPDRTGDPVRFGVICSIQDGVETWRLELKDGDGRAPRSFSGEKAAPPAVIEWDGLAGDGAVREGLFTPVLTVNYTKGDEAVTQAPPVLVDVSGPVLSFSSRPEYFSPDNDGVDDELVMRLGARDASPVASWSLEIREPRPPYPVFYRIEGRNSPGAEIVWDGRSNRAGGSGELVQAATDYPFTYQAVDALGNASSMEGTIGVDVLVIRDGDRLKIQVPSIIFRENAADFNTLGADVVDNNLRVLRRIAEILNKFRDYRVLVEGHANPVLRTDAEERNELQPLSEARARAVVNMLVEFGVARNRLSPTGMGGKRPVVRYGDRDSWWKNRRVEFILVK
jgi:outer membrane protein OmpA-like peptidoglycan-associated protein/flagellar hook assembly protein FlgD